MVTSGGGVDPFLPPTYNPTSVRIPATVRHSSPRGRAARQMELPKWFLDCEMEVTHRATRELTVSGGFSLDTKEQVRQAIDIVDLVGSYVPLRRQGRGYVGLCPWHDDTKPSLQVNPERQSFKCWVCDIGGDVFSFVMKAEGVEFREALEMLAERAGIALRPRRQPHPDASDAERREAGPSDRQDALAGDGLGRGAIPPLPAGIARRRARPAVPPAPRNHRREHREIPPRLLARSLGLDPRPGRGRGHSGEGARSDRAVWSGATTAAATTASRAACCFRSATPRAVRSGWAAACCPSWARRAPPSTSIRPRRRCSPRASCSTGWTWPRTRCGGPARRW